MGNTNGKKDSNKLFTADEFRLLENAYRNTCGSGSSDKLSSEKLVKSWSQLIERDLAITVAHYLFTPTKQIIDLQRFAEPYYIMDRGPVDMKLSMLLCSIDKVTQESLEHYIYIVVKSYLRLETASERSNIKDWNYFSCTTTERAIITLVKGLIRNLGKDFDITIPVENLECWLQATPQFVQIWREVFLILYSRQSGRKSELAKESYVCLIPQLCDAPKNSHYRPIIEIPHVIFLNSNLPREYRHKWRFLFSSKINGESFSTMLGKIINAGPTLIVIEDEDQYIFGGYAPDSWALRPQFVGNDNSELFTLSPAMRCFTATGYNDHYQYLNLNQQTMPNGLGMGGQYDYWGLWIDSVYGEGMSSESCTTYRDYVQLSKRKHFKIRNMEVWGIGDLPDKLDEDEGESTKRSILDRNMEDRAMLEIAGKKMHSDGLRDPDLDQ